MERPKIEIQWWESDSEEFSPDQRAGAMFEHARNIELRHQEQHENNLLYAQMYSNRELPSFDWGLGVSYEVSLSPISRLSENLSLSIVDTFVSQIGKNRPKASVVLRGAPWSLRRAARSLDRWLYSAFLMLGLYRKGKAVFRDAAIFGFGCARVDTDSRGRLQVDRVFPDDILVDQRECLSGQDPVHVFVRRVMTYAEAKARFGLTDPEIETAARKKYLIYRGHGPEHVVVVEAFRRSTVNEKGKRLPGWRMCAIDGKIIDEEAWNEEWLPLVFFNWTPPVNGWYNPGCVEQVFPYQIRLNEINEKIRAAQDLMSVPRVLVPSGSQINVNQVTNEIGKFIKYTGPLKPEALNWPGASPEIYGERDRLVKSCYEFMGISQMSAQARAPENARFDSSAAFREFNEIEQARFTDLSQRFEEFYLELSKTICRVMHRQGRGYDEQMIWRPHAKSKRSVPINWAEIDLDEDAYTISLEASSILNMSPAARLEALEQMRARGDISAEQYLQHMNNPDLEMLASLAAAASEDIDRVIELLEDGEYEAPTEFQDLINGIQKVHHAYLKLKEWDEVPLDIYENFETWILAAYTILNPEPEENEFPAAAMNSLPMSPFMLPPEGPSAVQVPPEMGGAPPPAPLPS